MEELIEEWKLLPSFTNPAMMNASKETINLSVFIHHVSPIRTLSSSFWPYLFCMDKQMYLCDIQQCIRVTEGKKQNKTTNLQEKEAVPTLSNET